MTIDQSVIDLARTLAPYLSPLLTALIAAMAIVYSRKSTKDTLAIQLQQRLWEKRTDLYMEMLEAVKRQNPYQRMTLEGIKEQAERREDQSQGEGASFLAEDPSSPEWQALITRIEAFASEETLSLYQL